MLLALTGASRSPPRRDLPRFALVGARRRDRVPAVHLARAQAPTSAHASVVVGLLPAATAAWAVARAGERPPRAFWLAAAAGLVAVLAFAATRASTASSGADLLVLAAVALGGLGYAEGGALSRQLRRLAGDLLGARADRAVPRRPGGARRRRRPARGRDAPGSASPTSPSISMFLGFFAWYHGLALGGVAKIGQVQLAQPVLTLLWAALVLGEARHAAAMSSPALAVLACVRRDPATRSASGEASGDVSHDERRRRRALDRHRHLVQRDCAPRRRAAARRSRRRARRRRAGATPSARPRAGTRSAPAPAASARCACSPTRSAGRSPSRWNASAETIALASKFAPEPHQRCPSQEPTVARRSRRASSRQAGDADRPCSGSTIRKSSSVAGLAPRAAAPRCRPRAARALVYGPHEKKRVTAGSDASSNSRGASAGVA